MRITGYKRQIIVVLLFAIVGVSIFFFAWYIISSGRKRVGRTEEVFNQIPQSTPLTEGPGLGQCHWIGGPFVSNPGVNWGYSGSTPFNFNTTTGGDSWSAIEQTPGVYTFAQLHSEVQMAKDNHKYVWLHISVAGTSNKEHNLPKWYLDQGAETVLNSCGNLNYYQNRAEYRWDDGTQNSVKPVWNNPKYVDQSEAVLLDINRNIVTNTSDAYYVRFPVRIAAVWDPVFRTNFSTVLRAMKVEFQDDIDSGAVQAIFMNSGGMFGECVFSANCEIWDTGCTPDIVNPECPIIKSIAKFVKQQHYPELTVEQVASQVIAKKSNCDPSNVIPGNKVQLCADQMNCPTQYNSACYVFDDYFIQAEKQMISEYVTIFSPTPIVWQQGTGLSHSGRVFKVLEPWMDETYGSIIWMRFCGWGSREKQFWTRNFDQYSNIGASGYEPDAPGNFSKVYYAANAQTWCNNYLTRVCSGDTSCLPQACKVTPLNTDEVGRFAVAEAIKRGIVADKSSFLCLQSTFFSEVATDPDGNGLSENKYFFNPSDQSRNCTSSEVNVAKYGYGFCPGYLNWIMKQNVPKPVNGQCFPNCTGGQCGSNGCGGSCGTCPSGQTCTSTGTCQATCVPNCTGKVCGSDGCEGSCGTCPSGQTCTSTGTCQATCVPNCTGKVCGSDGCEGSCGTCPSGQTCTSTGTCQATCVPNCIGRKCGSNGCGGSCGTCPSGQTCSTKTWTCQQLCTRIPSCAGKTCGADNGCGTKCTNCPAGQTCNTTTWKCQSPWWKLPWLPWPPWPK